MKKNSTKNLIQASMFLALGIVLPFFTAQIKEIGNAFLPMHLPIMLCGLICGPMYGFLVGFLAPLLRGAIFSMPPIFPNGIWMAFELAAYGFVIGYLYNRLPQKSVGAVYLSLIMAMISGRIVWGVMKTIVLGMSGEWFTFHAFIVGGILNAVPGIVLQLILIPAIMGVIERVNKGNQRKDS